MVSDRKHWLIFAAILLLALLLRAFAFSLFDTVHHDEIMQYQERAWRMISGHGLIPWEVRLGTRNALIPDLLAAAMAIATFATGDHWAAVISARLLFAALCFLAVPAAYAIGRVRSPAHGLVAMFVAAIWYESVLFGVQVLSESIATAIAACGAGALLRADRDRRFALLAGFCLALAVLLRLQYGAFAGMLVLLTARRDIDL